MNSPIGRKIRTEKKLKKLGIPINKSLPPLQNTSEYSLKKPEEIIDRMIAIFIVAAKGSGAPDEIVQEFIHKFDALPFFTTYEREFIACQDADEDELNTYSWKICCNAVMLWTINLIPDLPFPSDLSGIEQMYDIVMNSSREELIAQAKLRSIDEVLDELDFTYRLHWAIVNASIFNEVLPVKVSPGVVYERRYALNWLVSHTDHNWDHISMEIL